MTSFIRNLRNLKGFFQPLTSREAVELLNKYENSKPIAGGTDLTLEENLNVEYLVDLNFTDLNYVKKGKGNLRIGSTTTFDQLLSSLSMLEEEKKHLRALGAAVKKFGVPSIANIATIGGNVCEPVPSADIPPVLLALNSKLNFLGPSGERSISADEFFIGYRKTEIKKNEILREIKIPLSKNGEKIISDFQKMVRAKKDIAIVNVATSVLVEGRKCRNVRIGMGAVAPIPIRAMNAEKVLEDEKLSSPLIEKAANVARTDAQAISDFRASKEYREKMVEILIKRSLLKLKRDMNEF